MSKFKVRRSVPTVRLTGTQSLVTSGVNYVSTNPPQWITTPAPVFNEGYPNQQFDLGAYIYNYNQTTDSFSLAPGSVQLPSWLTFSGSNSRYLTANGTQVDESDFTGLVIRVTRAGLFSNSQPISVSVTDAVAFTLTSQLGGSDLPWAFGHAFRQGDISTGQSAVVSGANSYQCSIKTTWPDGSAKFAVLSGKADFTAGVAKVLSLVSGTASSGTTLTESDLVATGITAEFSAGAYGTASFSNSDFASYQYRWVSGHVMSSWTFRKVFSGDSNLVAWMEVRLYQGGAVEVLPWVELGFLTGSTVSNKSDTYTFTLGGTSRFSSSIDVKHHTRVPLLSGSTFAYWLGTDPQITPKHDRAYLMSTKLVPNYGWTSPSEGTLNGLQQTYTPNTLATVPQTMTTAGKSAALIGGTGTLEQALYITSGGDVRAYRAAVVFGLSGGTWHVHYRDPVTHDIPKLSSYPSISLEGGTPSIQGGSGGTIGSFGSTDNGTTHQPSFAYLPYLITGWNWFWEESAFWSVYNYAKHRTNARRGEVAYETGPFLFASGSSGVIDLRTGGASNRGAAWALRTLAQTLTTCSPTHATFNDWKNAWECNTQFYEAVFVNGTHSPGWVSPQGYLGDYSGATGLQSPYGQPGGVNAWWGAGWMSAFSVQVWGFTSELGLPQSTASAARHIAVRNQAYKQVVERAGDGTSYNWRRFAVYEYPIGADYLGLPPETWYTAAQSYSAYLAGFGLASIPATEGLSLKKHQSDTDIAGNTGDSAATDWFPFSMSALAYAVDHGAAGASAGWLRISGASNFNSIVALYNNSPSHGLSPRNPPTGLPSWVPAPGTRANVHTNSLAALNPCPTDTCWYSQASKQYGPWEQWTGAVYAPDYSAYGAMVYHGGGHGGYDGTEYYIFDLSTLQWSRIGGQVPQGYETSVDTAWRDYLQSGSYIVPAAHTYNHITYLRPANGGGTKGSFFHTYVVWNATRFAPHAVDLTNGVSSRYASGTWTPVGAGGAGVVYSGCFQDTNRGIIWSTPEADSNITFKVDLNTQTVTKGNVFQGPGYYGITVFVPEQDIAVQFWCNYAQQSILVRGVNLATGTPVTFSITRNTTQNATYSNGFGCDYCPDNGKFYIYEGRGTQSCITLTPPDDWLSGTWTWGSETFTGPTPVQTPRTSSDPTNGAYAPFSKWKYNRALKCFMWSAGPVTGTNHLGQSLPGVFQLWRPQGT